MSGIIVVYSVRRRTARRTAWTLRGNSPDGRRYVGQGVEFRQYAASGIAIPCQNL